MISNLKSAKALIQADLDHARDVRQLWQAQVEELEKALAQLDVVNTSRGMLRVEYAGQKSRAPILSADNATTQSERQSRKKGARSQQTARADGATNNGLATKRPRKRRALKAIADAALNGISDTPVTKRSARGAQKQTASSAVMYKDFASNKTWSGRGRRPAWLRGDPDHYLVTNPGSGSKGNPDAPEPANDATS